MTRSKIREQVFRMLFRIEFHEQGEFSEQLELFEEELRGTAEEPGGKQEREVPALAEMEYIERKCRGVIGHLEEIDALINEKVSGWKTSRMGKADLGIIRLAVYEILYEEDIPFKVSVNEAVELAKKYGTDDSASFVNGVLARFA